MKRNFASIFIILSIALIGLGACGRFKNGQQPLVPTVAQFEISNPKVQTSTNNSKVEFTGTAHVGAKDYAIKMNGEVDSAGMATLAPDDLDSPLRARLFCNGGDDPGHYSCDSFFVDVYFSTDANLENFLHTQLVPEVSVLPSSHATQASPQSNSNLANSAPANSNLANSAPVTSGGAASTSKPSQTANSPEKNAPEKNSLDKPADISSEDKGVASDSETEDDPVEDDALPTEGVYVGFQGKAQIQSLYRRPTTAPQPATPATTKSETTALPKTNPKLPKLPTAPEPSPLRRKPDQPLVKSDAPAMPNGSDEKASAHPQNQAWGCYAPMRNCKEGGWLENPSHLQNETDTYYLSQPEQGHFYGAYITLKFIDRLSKLVQAKIPHYRMRIGDIAQAKGGAILSMDAHGKVRHDSRGHAIQAHKSHQNGLDADLGYIMDLKEGVPTLAVSGGQMSSKMKRAEMWETFKAALHTQYVAVIFVDPVVKHGFCEYARSIGESESEREVLSHIQPLGGHQSHFHLRMHCTSFNPRCFDQFIPAGRPTGC